jgi:hypothetical protein
MYEAIATHQQGKHVSLATDSQAATKEMLETVFSMRFVASLCKEAVENVKSNRIRVFRMEAGSNTSTLALRAIGGAEK